MGADDGLTWQLPGRLAAAALGLAVSPATVVVEPGAFVAHAVTEMVAARLAINASSLSRWRRWGFVMVFLFWRRSCGSCEQ